MSLCPTWGIPDIVVGLLSTGSGSAAAGVALASATTPSSRQASDVTLLQEGSKTPMHDVLCTAVALHIGIPPHAPFGALTAFASAGGGVFDTSDDPGTQA